MKFKSITAFTISLFCLFGCSNAQQDENVLAEVNGIKLTHQFLFDQFPEEYRTSITKEQMSNAIDSWIETELLYQEAVKNKIDKDKQTKNLIEQKRKEIIAVKYVDMSVVSSVDIRDEEIDSVYYSQKDRFSVDEDLYNLSHIVLLDKNAADAVYKRLEGGDKFADLAADYSEDSESGKAGGDIGLLPLSAFEHGMMETISKTKIGEYTPPLKSQSGYYHIFLIKDKKLVGETLPLEEIRTDIAQNIFAQKRQAKYIELIDNLKKLAKIKRYPLNDKQ
ncbi:MAG: peptidyl-prolyl cis-trans isomerase [candidate division Zixibacteria bacterium]|nr:peptidyl-prolyl cis-trans isomerase [candidate division Zixibacteria bacterium]